VRSDPHSDRRGRVFPWICRPPGSASESFLATLECELIDRRRFKTQAEAHMAIFEFIEGFYNPRRRHSSIGYLSPAAYETGLLDPAARDPAIVLASVEARPGSSEIGRTTALPAGLDRRSTRRTSRRAGRDEKMGILLCNRRIKN
jgi:hypothetical protein